MPAAKKKPHGRYLIDVTWNQQRKRWHSEVFEWRKPECRDEGWYALRGGGTLGLDRVEFFDKKPDVAHDKAMAYVDGLIAAEERRKLVDAISGGGFRVEIP